MNKEMEAAREVRNIAFQEFYDDGGCDFPNNRASFLAGYDKGYNAHASRLAEAEAVIDHYARKATWNEAPVVALIPSGTAYGGDELKGYDKAREYRRKYPADDAAKGGGK